MSSPSVAAATRGVDVSRSQLPVFTKAFSDGWRSLLGWALGLAAAIFLYLPLFPSLGGNAQMQDLIDTLPKELTETIGYNQLSTGAGYTQSTIFGLIGFLLASIASIGWGAAALGGDEESGQLELTLAHGVTRVQVAVERFAAMAVKVLLLSALVFVLVLLLNEPAELDIDGVHLLGSCLLFGGLALLSGTVALLAGALTGRRVWGIGGGAFIAVLGYVFNAIGNQGADFEWLHALSPYSWAYADDPMTNGADWGAVIGLYAVSLVLGAVTAFTLRRRDIGV
ncbi:ABC transporter permease subunit [Saxibacter everestensis]|uniref:ABC transporter permease subunit n=1 Tax=Saxibacter everestensis TaxID=2909229 RepID=A0ABY8QVF9_9MICO|nr:ABC transporter permease subunit [Brevibacteriaceae bacterium ZFBP1038]